MTLDFKYLFTSFDGRINRAKYWAGAVILLVIWLIFGLIVNSIFGGTIFGGLLLIIALAVLFYAFYAVAAKRFQDRDKPGNTALYGLVPAFIANLLAVFGLVGTPDGLNALGWICTLVIWGVAIWFLIELGILKGTPGPNRFGGDPLVAVG
jgi:uncharacterized membrane protein YhaH (DUF805 family)